MHYKKWDLVLVPFPFTDFFSSKKRPALVVSPDEYNHGLDIVIVFVTSNLDVKPQLGDYRIQEWQQANLPKPSMIRMKFATIDKTVVVKPFGKLGDKDIRSFKQELEKFFL